MHARVSTYQTDDPDELLRGFQSVTDSIERVEGFSHAYFLFNRETGHAISVAIWDSIEELDASRPFADQLRTRATGPSGTETLSVGSYEVLHAADRYLGRGSADLLG